MKDQDIRQLRALLQSLMKGLIHVANDAHPNWHLTRLSAYSDDWGSGEILDMTYLDNVDGDRDGTTVTIRVTVPFGKAVN